MKNNRIGVIVSPIKDKAALIDDRSPAVWVRYSSKQNRQLV
ncbi:MAG TPA: hypothetical protein VE818_09510 [Nitrososphaeraceae archaeon]|nr:hypothetical protein [Nitrososphaeraceae archaeon]